MKNEEIIAGLDLGTTKVCAVIAKQTENGLEVLGFSSAPSEGLNRGLVANIAKTAEAIAEAMEVATNRAGVVVKSVNVGVAGEHITSLRHRNYVTISNPDREISQEDIDRLKADVRRIRIPSDKQILHIIPEEFIVDDQRGIEDPIGICGSRLEAVSHVVLAATAAIQNITKSVHRANYSINEYILQPIASSFSVLDENEMDLGIVLIDIGGGTTDIAVFHDRSIKHTKVIGVAGNQVTNDIREYFGIVRSDAERLKKEYGYATENSIIKDESIYINRVAGRGNVVIPVNLLSQVINARMKELFNIIDNELRHTGFKDKVRAGIVLTGGGSLLKGIDELSEEVFGLQTRIGFPLKFESGLAAELASPEYATVAGLIEGIPGSPLEEYQKTTAVNKPDRTKVSFSKFLRSIQKLFDDL